jgi:phosphatidylserine synthase
MSIPEPVAQRMGLRMISFVGIPFFGGMITFIIFWYYATYENLRFEPTLVATTTIVLLLIGLLVCSHYLFRSIRSFLYFVFLQSLNKIHAFILNFFFTGYNIFSNECIMGSQS